MKKTLVALLLLVSMLVNIFALASCDIFGKPDDGTDGEVEGKINIVFYHTMGENLRTVLNVYIEEFEELFPNIHVIHEQVGSYDDVRDTISTELTVGAQPNIAYCYPDHVALYNVAMAVTVLDDYIDYEGSYTFADGVTIDNIGLTQAQKDDFIKGYYEEGRQFGDGKMYTLPLSKSTEVLYYNKTFFDAHGLKVPTTWDEMEAICEYIKTEIPNSTPLGYDSENNWFITMCEQYGSPYTSATKVDGTNFLFDNETNWAFVDRFASWYAKGWVTTKELSGGYTSDAFKKAEGELGKSYMSIGSSAGATHQAPDAVNGEYPFEIGIAPIPQVNPEDPKVISQGPSVCIFQQENEQEVYASWLFVKFLTTDIEFQAAFSEASGYVPVIKSVNEDADYQEFLAESSGYKTGIAAYSAKVCLEQEKAYYVSPAFNGSSKARDEVGLLMQACFSAYEKATDKMAMIKQKFDEAIEECEY